jgi:hypothetical protein
VNQDRSTNIPHFIREVAEGRAAGDLADAASSIHGVIATTDVSDIIKLTNAAEFT